MPSRDLPFLALSVAQLDTPGAGGLLRNIDGVLSPCLSAVGPRGMSMLAWSYAVCDVLDLLVGVFSYISENPGVVRNARDMYQLYQADLSVRLCDVQRRPDGISRIPA